MNDLYYTPLAAVAALVIGLTIGRRLRRDKDWALGYDAGRSKGLVEGHTLAKAPAPSISGGPREPA